MTLPQGQSPQKPLACLVHLEYSERRLRCGILPRQIRHSRLLLLSIQRDGPVITRRLYFCFTSNHLKTGGRDVMIGVELLLFGFILNEL